MMRSLAAFLTVLLLTLPAQAHRLIIFAEVIDEEIVVSTKFSTGRVPASGRVTLADDNDAIIAEGEIGDGGIATFPLFDVGEGIVINVETANGHSDYWIVTKEDLEPAAPAPADTHDSDSGNSDDSND